MKTTSGILLFIFFLIAHGLYGQTINGKYYHDGHGDSVYIPLGDIAFADEVVSFKIGTPAPVERVQDPLKALGPPDFKGPPDNFVSLGCGGTITLRFTDNVLTDVEGPDIFVFEVGMNVEGTLLEISKDGKTWISIGQISGGQTSVDIKKFVKQYESFSFVRLTDMKTACLPGDKYPGADIDAVAAIGSGKNISLKSSVLFDFNKAGIRPYAQSEMDKVIAEIKKVSEPVIIVEGHTDSIGEEKINMDLSYRRALAISTYLTSKLGKKIPIKVFGYGDKYPVASNTTGEGREMNRRVEIIIVPGKK